MLFFLENTVVGSRQFSLPGTTWSQGNLAWLVTLPHATRPAFLWVERQAGDAVSFRNILYVWQQLQCQHTLLSLSLWNIFINTQKLGHT